MAQGSAGLNKNKLPKGGRRHQVKVTSKVDVLKKKKKDMMSSKLNACFVSKQTKFIQRCEGNLAAKASVEGNVKLEVVKVTPQQLAKAKDRLGGVKQKTKFNS
eukprot:TRINITY_DN9559_c0_g1_i1.p1 TRINITY_DN9559_c0_g1~~TRINITY_DN9559_c0_g1_i1.p1  ORF type:complete len:119 (-),score=31.80 TRINITY_DN9559_c0_g1_i1:218-526(-)